MDTRSKYFFGFLSLVFALILSLEIINQRFWLNDFKVYYGAADAYVHGKPVYGQVFGEDTGLYKYSPLVLWLFVPAASLPYFFACILHFCLVVLCFFLALRLAFRHACNYFSYAQKQKVWIFLLATLFCMNHLFRELHLGNVNVLLVAMLLLAYHLQERERYKFSGFIFALAIFVKPYFLLLALSFVITKNWRVLKSTAIMAVILLSVFTLINGFGQTYEMHRLWIESMQNHSEFLESFNTMTAILKNNFALQANSVLIAALLLSSVASFFWLLRKNKSSAVTNAEAYLLFCTLLALIPNLVITDTEHFLFSLPLIVLAFTALFHKGSVLAWAAVIFSLVLYGANLGDVIGDNYSVLAEHSGLLGLGNLLLVITAIGLSSKEVNVNTGSTHA